MSAPGRHAAELPARSVTVLRVIWFAQTIASTAIIGALDWWMPPIVQAAPQWAGDGLRAGLLSLGVLCLLIAKALRDRGYAPPPAPRRAPAAPSDVDPVALQRTAAAQTLIAGVLDAPFVLSVALALLTGEAQLMAIGALAPLIGGVLLQPDPARSYRALLAAQRGGTAVT